MQILNAGTKQGAGNSFSCFFNIVKHETVSYMYLVCSLEGGGVGGGGYSVYPWVGRMTIVSSQGVQQEKVKKTSSGTLPVL